jgi:hypothetical protein
MLRTSLLAACAATSLAMIAVGCGSDAAPAALGRVPPPSPEGAAACAEAGSTQAMDTLFLGDTTRAGKPDANSGWKEFGYNLDGLTSTKTSTGLCKPRAGGSAATIYPDGTEGIDNSFGKNILPIIIGLSSDLSTKANESIQKGEFTIMLDISKLGRDCTGAATKLYAGATLVDASGTAIEPKWDGNDSWPISRELLENPADPTSSKISFPQAYIAGNTWVSGTKGTVTLQLTISGFTLALDITNAYVTLDLADGNKSGTNGTIAGILDDRAARCGNLEGCGRVRRVVLRSRVADAREHFESAPPSVRHHEEWDAESWGRM